MFRNRIFQNASWLIGCRIGQAIFGLIVTMLTARYLGPSDYGVISYASSIVTFVVPIMQLGLANILVQEVVHHPEEEGEILGTSILMSMLSSFACIAGVMSFVCIANVGQFDTIVVCALYSINLVFQALELIQYWYQAKYLSKYTAIISLIAYVIVSAYKIWLLVSGKSIYWFAISYAIDYCIIAILLLIYYKKLGGGKFKFSTIVAKRMFSASKHYILSGLMVNIFAQTDKIMLNLMIDEAATGYYTAATTSAMVTSFVFVAIIDSARPAIFESKKVSNESYERNMSRLYSVITYLSLFQCLLMTIFAELIIRILYGVDYLSAINPLRLVVWYTTFSYLGSVRNIWVLAESKQRYLWIINLLGATCNVALNWVCIPTFGLMGAAFASLVTQFFTNIITGFFIKPIRRSNYLLFKGLNPMCLVELIKR